jgi:hypothetical protein
MLFASLEVEPVKLDVLLSTESRIANQGILYRENCQRIIHSSRVTSTTEVCV